MLLLHVAGWLLLAQACPLFALFTELLLWLLDFCLIILGLEMQYIKVEGVLWLLGRLLDRGIERCVRAPPSLLSELRVQHHRLVVLSALACLGVRDAPPRALIRRALLLLIAPRCRQGLQDLALSLW